MPEALAPAISAEDVNVATGSVAVAPETRPLYPKTAPMPTQAGPEGIRFDFNRGCRVLLPARAAGQWRVRLRDLHTGNTLFQSDNQGALVSSAKRWFVRFRIEVWSIDSPEVEPREVFRHDYDPAGHDVLIQFPVGTLGDTLAWFPYAERFAEAHPGSRVSCALSGLIIPLLRDAYPTLRLLTHEAITEAAIADTAYATYSLGLFFNDVECVHQPTDFRQVGLHRTAAYILGVDASEIPARVSLPDDTRPIAQPYVCIATQSSTQSKYWNNPYGWREVIAFLKASGYRVICIDQKPVHGTELVWNHIPHGAEDETGDRPLTERLRWLKHAAFFVGLSSGLSWLAWAAGTPVVMISGFTHPMNEFTTPFRVINWHACNSCWNDPSLRFDHKDFLWCPRHAGTSRQFECTRLITSEQVIQTIRRIPGVTHQGPEKPTVA
ncbi:MAG TPA: autotransporter strand-loop-strand O-heptosyltransferase [Rhodopila sp.]|uniref:autotransporter strand-loop-strand O-heptosyltransferase n=1 Tax=Rhodopila sp. TaxID=2480087 RepID=UPI002B809BAD|nr:autotransporter strand-loop-strand O-heptosyltransferase [Rhodopila sp.]HVY17993.1 autotransporter strand-loop-strand O-heptosyltransferase [Rhodopila sp.]